MARRQCLRRHARVFVVEVARASYANCHLDLQKHNGIVHIGPDEGYVHRALLVVGCSIGAWPSDSGNQCMRTSSLIVFSMSNNWYGIVVRETGGNLEDTVGIVPCRGTGGFDFITYVDYAAGWVRKATTDKEEPMGRTWQRSGLVNKMHDEGKKVDESHHNVRFPFVTVRVVAAAYGAARFRSSPAWLFRAPFRH
ncbi:hypothetical protein K438DRAFT_1770155 [Mycena galopus ATCC 62051]|nr:hypothetical protein K438DRAFT_1770155 [Mycena galopus ATCC 62051]